ncbi:N-glycosylation protein EOS1 [Moelleriella libera RCEF 2490]|uniref:N-glycosylation protein EOS1 n=1 Tax=Moelleriella libera RCEF 2490 TaxID=1081109 RepID=A0A168FB72_9HYPO|nr:N-glycosylation protein EOS1 [Moelleriella libera RCEF 2490]
MAHHNRRASSIASSPPKAESKSAPKIDAATTPDTDTSWRNRKRSQSYHYASPSSPSSHLQQQGEQQHASAPPPVHPSILQPRVAVVLNVEKSWHPWLFTFRLLSILPASWWGLPCALHVVLSILPGPERILVVRPPGSEDAIPFALTEGFLATIWVRSPSAQEYPEARKRKEGIRIHKHGHTIEFQELTSGMLIHYTPQATIVRLLTINAVNAYLTMVMLSLAGGFENPRLMLPGWIGIATINIRKETSTSINVFSIASYISMIILLVHMHSYQQNYPTMPVVSRFRKLWLDGHNMLLQLKASIERADL